MRNQFFKSIGVMMLLAFAGVASAAGLADTSFTVSATVAANCTIAATPVSFGTYDPVVANAATPLDATGMVTIACTKGTNATIALGLGANPSGSTRRMLAGTSEYLNYELYQQPGSTENVACNYTGATVWGTTGAGVFAPPPAPGKIARSYNICGRVAAGQDVVSGSYTDTVLATVNF